MIVTQGEWLMAIGCKCGVGVGMIVAQGEWQNDGYQELVWGGGFIVAWMADGYRVSMWNGDVSHLRG